MIVAALFNMRVTSLGSFIVLCEGSTPDATSTLVNCHDEACSQCPHRSHISTRLKNPGEQNDVLESSVRGQNVKAYARVPIEI